MELHFKPDVQAKLELTLVREYVIAYAPDKKPLWVVAVFDGRRAREAVTENARSDRLES